MTESFIAVQKSIWPPKPSPTFPDDCMWFPENCGYWLDAATNSTMAGPPDDHQGPHGSNALKGQITYTLIAAQALAWTALNLFRYRSGSQWDSLMKWMDAQGTNFFKWGSWIHGYGWLAFWSIAFVTQLLSDFGVAAQINMTVWMVGLGLGGMLINLVAHSLWYIAMDKYFGLSEDGITGASSAYESVRSIIMEEMGVGTAIGLALFSSVKDWAKAQLMAMPEEKRREIRDRHDAMKEGSWEDFKITITLDDTTVAIIVIILLL